MNESKSTFLLQDFSGPFTTSVYGFDLLKERCSVQDLPDVFGHGILLSSSPQRINIYRTHRGLLC